MIPFTQRGNTITFTAATSAPTPVQCASADDVGNMQYLITNTGSVLVFISCAITSAQATNNAVIPTGTATFVLPVPAGFQVPFTAPNNAYFTGITGSSTAVIYVTPGMGQ